MALRHTARWLFEATVPVVLVLLIIVVSFLSLSVFNAAHNDKVIACAAVDRSNNKTYAFLSQAVASGPRAHDPAVLDGLTRLRQVYDNIARDCRLNA